MGLGILHWLQERPQTLAIKRDNGLGLLMSGVCEEVIINIQRGHSSHSTLTNETSREAIISSKGYALLEWHCGYGVIA